MRKTIIFSTLGFIVVLTVLLVSFFVPRSNHEAAPASETADIIARPTCPTSTIGEIALPCLGATSGNTVKDITIVNLWAWWCVPCRTELPLMQRLAAENPQWDVVGVHADQDAARGAQLLTDMGVNLPSYQDANNTFAGTLGLPGVVPLTVVFRGSQQLGVLPRAFDNYNDLTAAIGELLNQ